MGSEAIYPTAKSVCTSPPRRRRQRDVITAAITCAFHWGIWGLLATLLSAQFLGIVWDSSDSYQYVFYGQSPDSGPAPISGTNDEPYSDRNIVCVSRGGRFVPEQLSAVLRDERLAKAVNRSVDGYRVCRWEMVNLDASAYTHYSSVCETIADALGSIQDRCEQMGFNVTRDALRIVDDTHAIEISRALPVLVMPYWDNAVHAHYAIPGWDGMACLFRLVALPGVAGPVVRAATRSSRDEKTRQWLGTPDGVWRNGWLEDGSGQRWYSDMMSSWSNNKLDIHVRHFASHLETEFDCTRAASMAQLPVECQEPPVTEQWGQHFRTTDQVVWANQVAISNCSRFGLFQFEALKKRTVQTSYSLETLISNLSITLLLVRWFVTLVVLLNSYRIGLTAYPSAGIGACISSSRTFNVLPLVLLPRLKITLAAFWTVGCEFEGQQAALAESWAAIYPGVAEFMLYYYSVLNFIAKLAHRRMSDVLFAPTLLFLCLLHRFRLLLGLSGVLGFDGRVSTVMMSDEVDVLRLGDFFTTDAALRINGNVKVLFYGKLAILVVNSLPLIFAVSSRRAEPPSAPCEIEEAIKIRAHSVGGIGQSAVYERANEERKKAPTVVSRVLPIRTSFPRAFLSFRSKAPAPTTTTVKTRSHVVQPNGSKLSLATPIPDHDQNHRISSYEVIRLGYLVFGGKFLMSYDDWYVVTGLAPLRYLDKMWNTRVLLIDVEFHGDCFHVVGPAQLCRLDDARLRQIPFFAVTVGAFR